MIAELVCVARLETVGIAIDENELYKMNSIEVISVGRYIYIYVG